jgi:hypothetical protein
LRETSIAILAFGRRLDTYAQARLAAMRRNSRAFQDPVQATKHLPDLALQSRHEFRCQRCHTVLVALACPDTQLQMIEVNIVHTQ